MATDVERLAVLIEANTKSYERAMTRMEQRTERAIRGSSKAVGRLDMQLKAMSATALRMAGAFGIGFSAIRLPSVIGDIVKEGAKLKDTADKVGLTTDQLQILRFAAQETGVQVTALDMGMQRFSRRVAQAAAGGGELFEILKANNIELKNADGSMRPINDILGDYANLIQNATSESDQLLLAFKGFDSEGAALVNTLRGGAAGLKQYEANARRLGAVMDRDLLAKAKQTEVEWMRFSTVVGTSFKEAVLDAVTATDDGTKSLEEFGQQLRGIIRLISDNLHIILRFGAAIAGAKAGAALGQMGGARGRTLGALIGGIGGFASPELFGGALDGVGGAQAGEGGPLKITVRPPAGGMGGSTRIPDTKAKAEADRRREQIEKVVEALELEFQNLTRTNTEQRVYNELAKAGADADSQAGQNIATLVRQIDAKREAMERAAAMAEMFGNTLYDALDGLILRGEKAEDVLKNLVAQLARAALQSAIFGSGGSDKGFVGLLGGLFGGARASGGPVDPNHAFLVGERGPEMFVPKTAGSIVPMASRLGGGGIHIPITISADGADPSQLARLTGEVSRLRQDLPSIVVNATRDANKRNVKLN